MRRALVAFGLAVPLALAGCNAGNNSGGGGKSPSESSSASSAATVKSMSLTCTGGAVTSVSLGNSEHDPSRITAAWGGTAPAVSNVSYILVLSSADGSVSRQAAFKRIIDTGEIYQFLYDLGTNQQTNIEPPDASQAPAIFPGALAGVSGDWTAKGVVSVDGQDEISCA